MGGAVSMGTSEDAGAAILEKKDTTVISKISVLDTLHHHTSCPTSQVQIYKCKFVHVHVHVHVQMHVHVQVHEHVCKMRLHHTLII